MLLYEQYCLGCFIKTEMLSNFHFFFHHKFNVTVL